MDGKHPAAIHRARAHVGDIQDATTIIHRLVDIIERDSDPSPLPWQMGQDGRTLVDAHGKLIGVMDRAEDAALVVRSVPRGTP